MHDENSTGAAYLAALKQSTPQAAATAPGPIIPASEKRRSPRHRCQGSAHIREVGSEGKIWATFTDISSHGCYVEAMSTFRMGAELALTIEVNGFRVECMGQVRTAYPNLGMGISFTTMSIQDRERLRELLRSLSRPSVILSPRVASNSLPSPPPDTAPTIGNPATALQALTNFFDERLILSREEFHRILRKSQLSDK